MKIMMNVLLLMVGTEDGDRKDDAGICDGDRDGDGGGGAHEER